jgi:hypothetical protein
MPNNTPQQHSTAQTAPHLPSGSESEQAVRQRRSREEMNEAWREMNERARTATEKRRKRDEAEEYLEELERRNAQFAEVNASALLGYLLAAAAPLGVWVIDVILLSRTAEYLIGPATIFSDYGVYIVTAALITLEMALSRQLVAAKREAQRYGELARGEDKKNYTRIKCMAAALAFAIPGLAVSSFLAVELAGTSLREMSLVKWGAILPTAGVAAVAHGFMIYSPEWIHDARGYLFYRLQWRYRRSRLRREEVSCEDACSQVADQFDTYQEAHRRCDELHPNEEIQFGPFSMHVRTALNDHYGFEYMAVPDGLGEDGDDPNTPPAPAPDSSGAPGGGRPTPPPTDTGAPAGDGAMPSEPSPESSSPTRPAPPADDAAAGADSAGEDNGDSQAMADYYRSVAEAQRRDADGEISL